MGGDRPSQTTRLTLSTPRIHGGVLEAQNTKGGISRVAPQQPKPLLHSLPPILSEMSQTPISGCSKGSRGLSVWPRVLGIFTETAISPSPSLRQRSSRYAIRAGRNFTLSPVSRGADYPFTSPAPLGACSRRRRSLVSDRLAEAFAFPWIRFGSSGQHSIGCLT